MKKKVLFIATLLVATQVTTAQVLYSENFDNLTLGNVGTDFTGATPGQGNLYTLSEPVSVPGLADNKYFRIVSESGKGKVLQLEGLPGNGFNYIQKRGIDALWNNRTAGNEILKIEYEFYTGDNINIINSLQQFSLRYNTNFTIDNNSICIFSYMPQSETVYFSSQIYYSCYTNSNGSDNLKKNTWAKLIYYLDLSNKRIYLNIPSLNLITGCDLFLNTCPNSLNLSVRGGQSTLYKFDNLIITAVNTVPLSNQDFISDKFNIYPNPVTNMLTITNSENIAIKELTVYDVNGKTIKEQKENFEKENTLNVDNLSAGTYILHIKTNLGIAVKKFIKK